MTQAVSGTRRILSTPYLTVAEYKSAPTALDWNNLVSGSTDAAVQDAELAQVIARASSWIDAHCNQVLGATLDSEQTRARIAKDGSIRVHTRFNPIVAVESFEFGFQQTALTTYPDCSTIWIEDQSFIVPYWTTQLSWSSQGPLQFGMPVSPRQEVFVRYSYVNGYPSTTLTANALSGATSITVKSGVGLLAGESITIYDGKFTEMVTIASNYTYGSTTVPLAAPLTSAHSSGVGVSALPPAVKQAAILLTSAFIKVRGDASMTMMVSNMPSHAQPNDQRIADDLGMAMALLQPFRRIR